jgi:hypothetical protein
MIRFPRGAVLTVAGMAVLLVGCGDKQVAEAPRAKVSGKITLNGKPVTTGRIIFDLGNGQPPGSFDILDGSYEGLAMIGKNRVIINATRKVSMKEKMKMDGPGYDQMTEENMIPPRYNSASEITREVVAGQPNEFNFDLKPN